MFKLNHTPSHTGTITAADPIRGDDIKRVRSILTKPRDIALWSVGTNSALRAGDLTTITWDDTEDDGVRITILLKESKTRQTRRIVLNPTTSADLRNWRRVADEHVIFPITVAYLGRLVKHWAKEAGVSAKRVSSHTLRKTWCRAHADRGEPLHKLMWALGHSSERQTATYLGLLTEEVAGLYEHVV